MSPACRLLTTGAGLPVGVYLAPEKMTGVVVSPMEISAPPIGVDRVSRMMFTVTVVPALTLNVVRSVRSSGPVELRGTITYTESGAKPGAEAATQSCPPATPVIAPLASTVEMLVALLTNVVTPGLGPESVVGKVVPMSTTNIFPADELKPADGATVIVADPLVPSLVPVMRALPTATPETTPCAETVPTAVLSDDQVIERESSFPFASLARAVA